MNDDKTSRLLYNPSLFLWQLPRTVLGLASAAEATSLRDDALLEHRPSIEKEKQKQKSPYRSRAPVSIRSTKILFLRPSSAPVVEPVPLGSNRSSAAECPRSATHTCFWSTLSDISFIFEKLLKLQQVCLSSLPIVPTQGSWLLATLLLSRQQYALGRTCESSVVSVIIYL